MTQRWKTEISPALGSKALAEITRGDCQALIDRIGANRPIAANRVASLFVCTSKLCGPI